MIKTTRTQRYLFSILSGILLVVSFPYTGSLTPLLFIALVPLLLVEDSIQTSGYRSSKVFIHSYITFFIYNLGTTWWIYFADSSGAIMAFLFNATLMALAFQAFHFIKRHVGRKEGYLGLLFIWISFEFLHHHWELSWPWLSFGNAFSIRPSIVQWYEYLGIFGGTLWVLVTNYTLFKIVRNVYFKKESWGIQTPLFIGVGLLLIVPISISLWMYSIYEIKGDPLEVVVVQPNIDPYNEKFDGLSERDQINRILHLADSLRTPKTDIVLAPETAIPYSFDEGQPMRSGAIQQLLHARKNWGNTELLIGASSHAFFENKNSRASKPLSGGPGFIEYYNTSVFIDTSSSLNYLHKSKLVLAVEKVPFSHWFPFLEEMTLEMGGTSGTLGVEEEPTNFNAKNYQFAPVICYESVYGGFVAEQCRKGANAIFIITNDGWWRNTPGHLQHLSFARLRAIENRKFVARSANTGRSAFIDPRGDVLLETDWWVQDAKRETILLNNERTFYMRFGDVLGRSFTFVSALLLLLAIVRKIRPLKKGI